MGFPWLKGIRFVVGLMAWMALRLAALAAKLLLAE